MHARALYKRWALECILPGSAGYPVSGHDPWGRESKIQLGKKRPPNGGMLRIHSKTSYLMEAAELNLLLAQHKPDVLFLLLILSCVAGKGFSASLNFHEARTRKPCKIKTASHLLWK